MLKRYNRLYNRIPYINTQESKAAVEIIQTVRNNFEGWTKKQVEKTILAHKVKEMVEHTTDESFKHMVSSKLLNNHPLKLEDVTNTHTIFGI